MRQLPVCVWYEEEYFIVCKKLNENIEECDKITLVLTDGIVGITQFWGEC